MPDQNEITMKKSSKSSSTTRKSSTSEADTLAKWRATVAKVRTLADLSLTPIRAYGCHELSKACTSGLKPADFEEQVGAGTMRVVYWGFGLVVAINVGDSVDEIGHVVSLGYGQGGSGPLEVHDLGFVDGDGAFVDPVEMAGTDLMLPFTRTTLSVEVMDGQRVAR